MTAKEVARMIVKRIYPERTDPEYLDEKEAEWIEILKKIER